MEILSAIRWCFCGLLGLFSIHIITLNLACVYVGLVRKEHHSMTPLIGGFIGLLALFICPIASTHALAWLPLVLDLGCVFSMCSLLYHVIVLEAFK